MELQKQTTFPSDEKMENIFLPKFTAIHLLWTTEDMSLWSSDTQLQNPALLLLKERKKKSGIGRQE